MSIYVLDTHIWLWSLAGEFARMPKSYRSLLESAENDLVLSSISVWEALLLHERKRIQVQVPLIEPWLRDQLDASPLQEAPLNNEIVFVSRRIKLPHQDPADRFIAATAKVYGAKLLTVDESLLRSKDIECVRR